MQRIRRTDEEWMDLIRECKSSGVSDQVWLKQKQIPASSYYRKYQQLCRETEWIFRCGGAASPVWREPPVRTNGATCV